MHTSTHLPHTSHTPPTHLPHTSHKYFLSLPSRLSVVIHTVIYALSMLRTVANATNAGHPLLTPPLDLHEDLNKSRDRSVTNIHQNMSSLYFLPGSREITGSLFIKCQHKGCPAVFAGEKAQLRLEGHARRVHSSGPKAGASRAGSRVGREKPKRVTLVRSHMPTKYRNNLGTLKSFMTERPEL
jgi:hypothetical protein